MNSRAGWGVGSCVGVHPWPSHTAYTDALYENLTVIVLVLKGIPRACLIRQLISAFQYQFFLLSKLFQTPLHFKKKKKKTQNLKKKILILLR